MRSSLLLAAALLLALLAAVGGCAMDEPDSSQVTIAPATNESPIIYGNDDRREYYQIGDPLRSGLAQSTVALMQNAKMTDNGDGTYTINTSTSFAQAQQLCAGEPFRTQPASAYCSGSMVGPDLIATAGHCVGTVDLPCSNTTFVFGFWMADASTIRSRVPADDVYRCSAIVDRVYTSTNDFAIVRVDRAIAGHNALAVRRAGAIALGTPLVVAGHPSGIPLKLAGGAVAKDTSQPDYFSANLDSYGGNSGSPVVNASTLVLEGILVRGNTDFVYNRKQRCYSSNVCNDSGCPGWEDVTRTTKFVASLPCSADADCDDRDPCNGVENCDPASGRCSAGVPVDCDDANACTVDACTASDPSTAACSSTTRVCNDSNACTIDSCNPASGCVYTPIACNAGYTCSNGACVPQCKASGQSCSVNGDCCSRSCRRNVCR